MGKAGKNGKTKGGALNRGCTFCRRKKKTAKTTRNSAAKNHRRKKTKKKAQRNFFLGWF